MWGITPVPLGEIWPLLHLKDSGRNFPLGKRYESIELALWEKCYTWPGSKWRSDTSANAETFIFYFFSFIHLHGSFFISVTYTMVLNITVTARYIKKKIFILCSSKTCNLEFVTLSREIQMTHTHTHSTQNSYLESQNNLFSLMCRAHDVKSLCINSKHSLNIFVNLEVFAVKRLDFCYQKANMEVSEVFPPPLCSSNAWKL